jgi:hypothetical protein
MNDPRMQETDCTNSRRKLAMTRGAGSLLVIALGALTPLTAGAQAQSYPNRSIRYIVPYTPGGAADILARAVGRQADRSVGTIGGRREPRRRRHERRIGSRSALRTRRLYAVHADHRECDQSDALRQAHVRSGQGLRLRDHDRESARHRRRAPVGAGEKRKGADCARQGASQRAASRLDRHRQPAPPRR